MSFTTSLSPEACRQRLKDRCAGWGEMLVSGFTRSIESSHPLYGRVTNRGFSLFMRIRYRNSFQTEAAGRFREEGGRTRVDVRFGMAAWVWLATAVWFGLVSLVGLVLLFMVATRGLPMKSWFLLPFGMIIVAIGVVWFGRWLARNEEGKLRALLTEVLQAPADQRVWEPIE
jgi:hypothetical protein